MSLAWAGSGVKRRPRGRGQGWLREDGPSVLGFGFGFGFEDGVQHGAVAGQPGAGMGGGVDLGQLGDGDVGVDLGGV